jgi:dephospho-CoA kinase
MKRVVGLTGGVASGKSAVARILKARGIPVVDADQVSHELLAEEGPVREAVIARFGTADRAELRARVFARPEERRALEAILHPAIRAESERRIRAFSQPLVVYEAALLVETGRARELDALVVVEAPLEARIERLMKRDGCARADAERIVGSQATDEARRAAATYLITNDEDLVSLEEKVLEVLKVLSHTFGLGDLSHDSHSR